MFINKVISSSDFVFTLSVESTVVKSEAQTVDSTIIFFLDELIKSLEF